MVMYKIIKILAAITVAISTHQSITESCEAHKFVKTEGMELPNQVIRTIVKSFVQLCWGECAWWPKCISVNARKVDEIFFECDLNDSNTTTKELVPREESDYYEMTEPEEQICKLYSCKKKHIASVWGAWSDTCKLPRTRTRKCINPVTQADENDCSGSSEEEVLTSSACSNPASLGVRQGGSIPDANFNASSYGDASCVPSKGRLNAKGSWCASRLKAGEWLEVDLNSVKNITSFLSQGGNDNRWVTEFYLEYRKLSSEPWKQYDGGLSSCAGSYVEINQNVTSGKTIVTTHLPTPIIARYVRMVVIEWHHVPSMRMDLFGC